MGSKMKSNADIIYNHIEKQIIECISKSNVKGKESIYAYTSVYYYEKNNTNFNTNSDTDLSSSFNRLRVISNTNSKHTVTHELFHALSSNTEITYDENGKGYNKKGLKISRLYGIIM